MVSSRLMVWCGLKRFFYWNQTRETGWTRKPWPFTLVQRPNETENQSRPIDQTMHGGRPPARGSYSFRDPLDKTTDSLYLNNETKPYISIIIPTKGHPNNTIRIPPRNATLPLNFCSWKKKRKVRWSPITNVSPVIKRICKDSRKIR